MSLDTIYQIVWFDATAAFDFPSHTSEHALLQISSPYPVLGAPPLTVTSSVDQPKKTNLQSPVHLDYRFFNITTHLIGALLSKLVP